MTDWPILSAVTFLPLVGVALLLLTREDSPYGRRNILNVALLTTVFTFVAPRSRLALSCNFWSASCAVR